MTTQHKILYYEWFIVLCAAIAIGGGIQLALANLPISTAIIIVMCVFFIRLARKKIKKLNNYTNK